MTPQEAEGWLKVAIGVGSALAGTITTWALMRRDVADLKEAVKGGPDDWSLPEIRRQLKAVWAAIEVLKQQTRDLELADARAISDMGGYLKAQKDRIDSHAVRNDQQQVKNAEFFAQEAKAALDAMESLALKLQAAAGGKA